MQPIAALDIDQGATAGAQHLVHHVNRRAVESKATADGVTRLGGTAGRDLHSLITDVGCGDKAGRVDFVS